jgi:hypothetical protein
MINIEELVQQLLNALKEILQTQSGNQTQQLNY